MLGCRRLIALASCSSLVTETEGGEGGRGGGRGAGGLGAGLGGEGGEGGGAGGGDLQQECCAGRCKEVDEGYSDGRECVKESVQPISYHPQQAALSSPQPTTRAAKQASRRRRAGRR